MLGRGGEVRSCGVDGSAWDNDGGHLDVAGLEGTMGNKDKGQKSSKKAAAKSLKEKRLEKKAKKAAHDTGANRSVDRTFDR
jgi:hypothetical protein